MRGAQRCQALGGAHSVNAPRFCFPCLSTGEGKLSLVAAARVSHGGDLARASEVPGHRKGWRAWSLQPSTAKDYLPYFVFEEAAGQNQISCSKAVMCPALDAPRFMPGRGLKAPV